MPLVYKMDILKSLKEKTVQSITVLRDGEETDVDASELVVGDIVLLDSVVATASSVDANQGLLPLFENYIQNFAVFISEKDLDPAEKYRKVIKYGKVLLVAVVLRVCLLLKLKSRDVQDVLELLLKVAILLLIAEHLQLIIICLHLRVILLNCMDMLLHKGDIYEQKKANSKLASLYL